MESVVSLLTGEHNEFSRVKSEHSGHPIDWETLARQISKAPKATAKGQKNGSIVMVGTGIMCVGEMTIATLGHIQSADRIFYCVADPVTEAFIKKLRPDAMDLYVFYDDDKPRINTYVQMSEAMLHDARRGMAVVGIFYGHPGVFVLPSHRAIKIAQEEGIAAKMLPAPSAEDSLVADLGIDPSFPGMQTYEATDFLLRRRTLLTDLHVLLWQVGCVGDSGFKRTGYKNDKFHVLVERLQEIYADPEYEITHYIGAQYPVCEPTIRRHTLSSLLDPEVRKTFTGLSTMYLPPHKENRVDPDMACKLGMPDSVIGKRLIHRYDARENAAVKALGNWRVPDRYEYVKVSPLAQLLSELTSNPSLLKKVKTNGVSNVVKLEDPSAARALKSLHPGRIRLALKGTNAMNVQDAVISLLRQPKLSNAYYEYQKKEGRAENWNGGAEATTKWLTSIGLPFTADELLVGLQKLQQSSILPWTGYYTSDVGALQIVGSFDYPSKGQVLHAGKSVKNFTFDNSTLKWSAGEDNATSAEIAFFKEANHNKIMGYIWTDGSKPSAPNVLGLAHSSGAMPRLTQLGGMTIKTASILIGIGMATMFLSNLVMKLWEKARALYIAKMEGRPTEELEKAVEETEDEINSRIKELDQGERQADIVDEDMAGDDIPDPIPDDAVPILLVTTDITIDTTTAITTDIVVVI